MASRSLGRYLGSEDTATDLVALDRLEEGAEIAFAKALVAFALNNFEKDRTDHRLGEDLQQQSLAGGRRTVDQDPVAPQAGEVLAVSPDAGVDRLVIGVGDRHERDSARPQRLDAGVDVVGGECYVLDALAVIGFEIFGDLRFVVGALVDRDADPAVG